jgi:hypothetical protein
MSTAGGQLIASRLIRPEANGCVLFCDDTSRPFGSQEPVERHCRIDCSSHPQVRVVVVRLPPKSQAVEKAVSVRR